MLREQVLEVVSKDVAAFIRERKPKHIDELTELAENYIEVHGGANFRGFSNFHESSKTERKTIGKPINEFGHKENPGPNKNISNSEPKDRPAKGCFLCGGLHYAQDCRMIGATRKPDNLQKSFPEKCQGFHLLDSSEPIVQGRIGDRANVKVLRDSECTNEVIHAALCNKDEFTGKWVNYRR